jgi:hypothetical protein
MVLKGYRLGTFIVAAIIGLAGLGAGLVGAAEVHSFANGITATIYTPAEITDRWITPERTGPYLTHPAAGSVALQTPAKQMYPFDTADVVRALAAMNGFVARVDVDVFILPAIPREAGGSFARRNALYLAPGTGPVDPATAAYITVHEMGHVLTWVYLDNQPARWRAYLDLRGLDESSLDPNLRHADRAREILAEDIRALFGGPLATVSDSIENHHLVHPRFVDGLAAMLAEFFLSQDLAPVQLTSQAFPNPCNPQTTIEMALPQGHFLEGGEASLRIYDIRGAAVKSLKGGFVANNRVTIPWDGTDMAGEGVASGRYLYVIEIDNLISKGGVTLVR